MRPLAPGLNLTGIRLPRANFEGLRLVNVVLTDAELDSANFRSAQLHGVLFQRSNLRQAIFDGATLTKYEFAPVDCRGAELGGASFVGAEVRALKLAGAIFSEPTLVVHFLEYPCFEEDSGAWTQAAGVYAAIGRRAAEDWDFDSADDAAYLAMTCRHRLRIGAQPLVPGSHWANWIWPTLRKGAPGALWMAHRWIWGYGLRPLQALAAMLAVITFWGLLVYPVVGFTTNTSADSLLSDSLLLSLMTFVTLSFSRLAPSTGMGELAAGIEGFLGSVLLALFLVSLAGRYIRRF